MDDDSQTLNRQHKLALIHNTQNRMASVPSFSTHLDQQ